MHRILLIDDDTDYLGILENFLSGRGYVVKCLDSWNHAPQTILTFKPDLVVLDVFLGGEDGLSACRKIKENSYTRDIPVLIISGYPKVKETAIREYGAEDFMAKPFSIQDFLVKVEHILTKHEDE